MRFTPEEAYVQFNPTAPMNDSTVELYHRSELLLFLKHANLQKGENVLDVGCGKAWKTIQAKKMVGYGRVVGIDVSHQIIKLNRENPACDDIEMHVADMTKEKDLDQFLPQANWKGFNVILSQRFWCFMEKKDQVMGLHSLTRILAPNGRIVVDFVHPKEHVASMLRMTQEGMFLDRWTVGDERSWQECREAFKELIKDAKLEVVGELVKTHEDVAHDIEPDVVKFATAEWKEQKEMTKEWVEKVRQEFAKVWVDRDRIDGYFSCLELVGVVGVCCVSGVTHAIESFT